MKPDTFLKPTCWLLIGLIISGLGHAHRNDRNFKSVQTDELSEVVQFQDPQANKQVAVHNVYGHIEISGHAGSDVIVEATRTVRAIDDAVLQEGLSDIGIRIESFNNNVYVLMDSPYSHFDPDTGEYWHSDTCWRRDDCSRRVTKKPYRYRLDLRVKVPHQTDLVVSAVNQGDVTITDIHAERLIVNNVNGGIDMNQVTGQTVAEAINQDVRIQYSENPSENSRYASINGDLIIRFAEPPNAEVVYQTMHGDLYTPFDVALMAPKVVKNLQQEEHGIKYQLDAENRLKIGNGGPEYRFKTLNGDIKIK